MDEHDRIKELAWRVVESSGADTPESAAVRAEFRVLLEMHSAKEEAALYPLLVESGDLEDADRVDFEAEHRELLELLDSGGFDAETANVLATHIEAEELDLFPFTMYVFDDEQWEVMERVSHDMFHRFGVEHHH